MPLSVLPVFTPLSSTAIRALSFIWRTHSRGAAPPPNEPSTHWWSSREIVARPWDQKKQNGQFDTTLAKIIKLFIELVRFCIALG